MSLFSPARDEPVSLPGLALFAAARERESAAALVALAGQRDYGDDWNPALDECAGAFDVHLGVYTRD